MKWSRILSGSVAVVAVVASLAHAQLTDFTWNNPALVGAQSWQVDGNWNMVGFPNDPGRMDADATVIVPSIGANTSVALTGDLSLDVGATNVTVASLTLGSTGTARTTDVTSVGGGKLVFENYELNDTSPVDPNPDICAFNCGSARIVSGGVAGSTNLISAPVHINGERLEIGSASTNDLTISGPITFANLTGTGLSASSIRSFMPAGKKLVISGSISLVDTVTTVGAPLVLNDNGTAPPVGTATGFTSVPASGTIEISGVINDTAKTSGSGTLAIGTTTSNAALGTVILSGTNIYTGRTTLNRSNLVLANDSALGVDSNLGNDRSGGALFANGNPSGQFGFNFLSDNDARTISVDASFAQWQTVTGEHSLSWNGLVTQSNTRGWVNLLPAGKSLTVNGVTFAQTVSATDTSADNRIFTYDGTGTTYVTGGWRNKIKGGTAASDASLGHFRKTGTGVLLVSDPGAVSDFSGDIIVEMGNIHFASDTIFTSARGITSIGGAIGIDTGTFSNAGLFAKLTTLDNGGLMLTPGESAANIDFAAGTPSSAPYMSVAAPETGITYTGTITPSNDLYSGLPTYRLGGGSGTLTLNGNQLTGARNAIVTNGGEVALTGGNTYSGTTSVVAKYHSTTQNQAIANTNTNISTVVYEGTTLAVSNLVVGASSSLGSSSASASNLVIQGSTLKYTGTGSSGTTTRLFTVGTGGATIDASGSSGSELKFTSTSALDMDIAEARPGYIVNSGTNVPDGVSGGINANARLWLTDLDTSTPQRYDDLVTGMPISGLPSIAANATVTAVNYATDTFTDASVTMSAALPTTPAIFEQGMVSFGGVARTLTLTGANTGNNTMSPLIGDAAAATGVNTVNLAKTGVGKWILSGNNTYAGTTTVSAGTLLINGTQTSAGLTTVASGASFGGTGQIGGGLTMLEGSIFTAAFSGGTIDPLHIVGDLDLSALDTLSITGTGVGSSWTLMTYAGTLMGMFDSTPGYTVDYSTTGLITISAATGGLVGDYNNDGKVNAADYTVWRDNLGAAGSTLGANRDPANMGVVSTADYNSWKANFGAMAGAGGIAGAAVPEPGTCLLFGMALAGLGFTRRRS